MNCRVLRKDLLYCCKYSKRKGGILQWIKRMLSTTTGQFWQGKQNEKKWIATNCGLGEEFSFVLTANPCIGIKLRHNCYNKLSFLFYLLFISLRTICWWMNMSLGFIDCINFIYSFYKKVPAFTIAVTNGWSLLKGSFMICYYKYLV